MKRRVERWLAFSVWAALVTFALPSYAQQVTQSFDLHPGWNAIYLEVEPEPERTSDVFQGLPVASVWAWIPRRSSAEFIQDPNEQLLSEAGWLGWFPDTRPEAFLTDLFTLQSNRAYLVNVEGTSNVTLEVTGKPAVPRPRWTPDAFNLVGFHVDPGAPPTFANFLAPAAALSGQTIYGLNNDGSGWEPVDPDTTTIQSGEAYWVFSQGGSDYVGPLGIRLEQLDRMDYGAGLEVQTLRLENLSSADQSVSLEVLPAGSTLAYRDPDPVADEPWLDLPYTDSLAVGEQTRLPLGIRRSRFAPGSYTATLQITGSAGSRWRVPVAALAPLAPATEAASALLASPQAAGEPVQPAISAATVSGPATGLWVGTVSVDTVNEVHSYQRDCDSEGSNSGSGFSLCLDADDQPIVLDPDTPMPVAAEFSFRILIHVDAAGQVRLLKSVIQMWEDGVDDNPGRFLLITDDSLLSGFEGVALRDGERVGRRISAVAYDFPGDFLPMTGTFGDTITATLVMDKDFATNPFKHAFHRGHDNLSDGFDSPADEAFDIERTMTLEFTAGDGSDLGAGYALSQGTFAETVTGLTRPGTGVQAEGTFDLRRVASTGVLNE